MGVDHSKAFVRITFDGIIVFCLNKRAEPDRCEMGMVSLRDHRRLLKITKINPNGSEELFHPVITLENDNDVTIDATDPIRRGVTTFQRDLPSDPFDRIADTGDPEDFRWVMDIQGPLMHGNAASMRRDYRCQPKINIPHGIFYTHSKTAHQYSRIPLEGSINTGTQPLGKLADKIGADLVCDPLKGKVTVKVRGLNPIPDLIPDGLQTRYRIDITNLCTDGSPKTSDFPHYYEVVSDIDGIKFDLKDQKVLGFPGQTKTLVDFLTELGLPVPEGFEKFGANGPPQVCNVAFMSSTNTIP